MKSFQILVMTIVASLMVWTVSIAADTAKVAVSFDAKLVDSEANASKRSAVVEVKASGLILIDPALSTKMNTTPEGHFHYQVDNGFVIATPVNKLSFHNLSSGTHQISVSLADNDHKAIGLAQVLMVTIP